MKVIFLGTGTSQGVPVIGCHCPVCTSADQRDQRLRASVYVESGNERIVIDCGPDFRQQMLREKIEKLDAILLTHAHKDHVAGLDDVRAYNFILGREMDVWATPDDQAILRKEFDYAFLDKPYPGAPRIRLHDFSSEPFIIGGSTIIPVKAMHYPPDLFVYGFRIGDFTYLTDAVGIPEEEKKKIVGSRVVVLNALRRKKHYSHFNLEEAVALMQEFRPEMGFLTHISHQMGLHEEVTRELPGFVSFAYDGLTVNL